MMSLEISLLSVTLITVVVLFGGLVTGITGFGYALISTMTLAMLFDPQSAVALMIIPALVANVRSCVNSVMRDSSAVSATSGCSSSLRPLER